MKTDSQTLSLLWLLAVAAIFYFMILRPQQQRTKKHEEMKRRVAVGDKVVTVGGVHGTVKSLAEGTMTLQVADNTKIVFSRDSLASIASPKNDTTE